MLKYLDSVSCWNISVFLATRLETGKTRDCLSNPVSSTTLFFIQKNSRLSGTHSVTHTVGEKVKQPTRKAEYLFPHKPRSGMNGIIPPFLIHSMHVKGKIYIYFNSQSNCIAFNFQFEVS
jgi:hypothetical protein